MEDRYQSVGSFRSGQLLGDIASPASACGFFFPGLDFFRIFICEADLLVEIFLDELEFFPSGLEEDVIKLCDRRVYAQRI